MSGDDRSDARNVGIAFALVTGAGASTAIGAAVVFFPALVKLASRKTLAGALGFSAGVMMYVSFAEILQKALQSFEESEYNDSNAYLYATLSFFAGVVFMSILSFVVHNLLNSHGHGSGHGNRAPVARAEEDEKGAYSDSDSEVVAVQPPCCQDNPGEQLDDIHRMAGETEKVEDDDKKDDDSDAETDSEGKEENRKLVQMSVNTAVAIALHNFPEGLATFVAAINDPAVGGILAIAIAIHNIPEGLCVAMPVYYGTGSRMRAFLWALFSGISEPIAAIFGYLILSSSFSDSLFGALFGIVSGMMVIISVKELLPTAHRYDPHDTVVTNSFIAGMVVMAVSLVLFVF